MVEQRDRFECVAKQPAPQLHGLGFSLCGTLGKCQPEFTTTNKPMLYWYRLIACVCVFVCAKPHWNILPLKKITSFVFILKLYRNKTERVYPECWLAFDSKTILWNFYLFSLMLSLNTSAAVCQRSISSNKYVCVYVCVCIRVCLVSRESDPNIGFTLLNSLKATLTVVQVWYVCSECVHMRVSM